MTMKKKIIFYLHSKCLPYVILSTIIFLVSIILIGCGGSNNPNGSIGTATLATQTNIATDTVEYGTLLVQLNDDSYNASLALTEADITVQLYQGTSIIHQLKSLNNQTFFFEKVNPGVYTIKVIDSKNIYKTAFSFADIKPKQNTTVSVNIIRNPDPNIETVNIIGRVVDSLHNAPIMFAVIELYPQDQNAIPYKTITSGQGYFMFEKITSGTWIIKASKSNYTTSEDIIMVNNKNSINFRDQNITSTTTINNARADGGNISGFYISDIKLTAITSQTGGIYGRLKNPNTNDFLDSTVLLELYYHNSSSEEEKPKKVYFGFKTNDKGYLHLINLEPGYYTIARINSTVNPVLIGTKLTYSITPQPLIEFIKVEAGKTSELPSSGFDN